MLLGRIELPTSSLPMTRSTTELQQQLGRRKHVFAGQARPMAGSLVAVKPRDLTPCRFRKMGGCVSKTPSPADLERERRLAEALRANLRKRKAQARDVKADDPPKD